MKVLKFQKDLVGLVLSGEKTSTWRLFDDKDLLPGDEIELKVFSENKPFAKAKITEVTEKLFGDLSDADKQGHEGYENDEEMYKTYSDYYGREITPQTMLKIVRFSLIEKY